MRYGVIATLLVPMLVAGAMAVEPVQESDGVGSKAEAVKADPNSTELLNAYMSETVQSILGAMETDSDAAEKALAEMKAVIESLSPQAEDAQQMLARAKSVVPVLEQRITLSRVKLEELQAKLKENLNDPSALEMYSEKLVTELSTKAFNAPAEAKELLAKSSAFLTEASDKATEKQGYQQILQTLEQFGETIESNLAREQMIGKDASPLQVEAWVNGEPLTDSDLEGKVVLLDFWAVWCGPCIATFPHLIEWNEQYKDKGLVIIGMTNYYEFGWDEAAGRAAPKPGTTPEQEQEMLVKFADSYDLTHRFAIDKEGAMSEFYQVSGIPQAVVIDQQGKVRMVRVGSGEANAKAIGDLLAELLGSPDAAGE